MAGQLRIFEPVERRPEWVIDEATRAAGRKGLAEARAALRAALEAQRQRDRAPRQGHGRAA